MLAKKMISVIKVDCPNGCNAALTYGDLQSHLARCPNKKYTCKCKKVLSSDE